jgi:hypothetical protein
MKRVSTIKGVRLSNAAPSESLADPRAEEAHVVSQTSSPSPEMQKLFSAQLGRWS